MTRDILICGVGGQGTVLASRILAAAGINENRFVRTAETIGMAQRGGCVVSHVRIDSEEKSSLIPHGTADLLIGFEPAEAVRNLLLLKADAPVIINKVPVIPVTASLGGVPYNTDEIFDILKKRNRCIMLDANEIACKAGSPKAVNVVLLGAALGSGCLDFSYEAVEKALRQLVPAKLLEINLCALKSGYEEAK